MNKSLIIGLITAVIIFAVGYYLVANQRKSADLAPVAAVPSNTPTPEKSLNSLKDLFSAGTAQSCTFATEIGGIESKGTIYVNENNLRGDFDSEIDGKPVKTHMVIMNNTTYIWSEGQNKGFKMAFDGDSDSAEELANQAKLDINEELDYDCDPWDPDNSVFTLPDNIQFATFGDMMKNIPTGNLE